MVNLNTKITMHPTERELADFLADKLSKDKRERVEKHLGSCDQCLDAMVAAHEAVAAFNKKKPLKKLRETIMKKINIYLLLAIISFSLSFITPRFFIQLLVATLLLGIKWVSDSKSTRMLVMIYEAWKRDGARGATDVLETLDTSRKIFQE
jgi:hypothetical protein